MAKWPADANPTGNISQWFVRGRYWGLHQIFFIMSSRHHDHNIKFAIFLPAISGVLVGIPRDGVDDEDDPVLWG